MGRGGLAFHHPFQRGFTIDDIIVSCQRDIFKCDFRVIDHGGLVAFVGELHLGDVKIRVFEVVKRRAAAFYRYAVRFYGFVVDVQFRQRPPCVAERPKIRRLVDTGDARQFFTQIVGIAGFVVFGMQQTVDVIKQVFFADGFVRVCGLEVGKDVDSLRFTQTVYQAIYFLVYHPSNLKQSIHLKLVCEVRQDSFSCFRNSQY